MSSSTDLPKFDGRNLGNISAKMLLRENGASGAILEEFEGTSLEELSAIDELKRARQLRGDFSVVCISPNKKPTRVGVAQVGLSDIR